MRVFIVTCLIWLTVFKSSSICIMASVFVASCSYNLSCFKISCKTNPQLWSPPPPWLYASWGCAIYILYLNLQCCCAVWNCWCLSEMWIPIFELIVFCSMCILAMSRCCWWTEEGRSWLRARLIQCFVKWPHSSVWLLPARLWLSLRCLHLLNGCGLLFKKISVWQAQFSRHAGNNSVLNKRLA